MQCWQTFWFDLFLFDGIHIYKLRYGKKISFTVNSPFMQLPTKPDFCKLIENIWYLSGNGSEFVMYRSVVWLTSRNLSGFPDRSNGSRCQFLLNQWRDKIRTAPWPQHYKSPTDFLLWQPVQQRPHPDDRYHTLMTDTTGQCFGRSVGISHQTVTVLLSISTESTVLCKYLYSLHTHNLREILRQKYKYW